MRAIGELGPTSARWATQRGSIVDGNPVGIGAERFDEDVLIAHAYAAGRLAQGVDAAAVELDGFRDLEVASVLDREIDLVDSAPAAKPTPATRRPPRGDRTTVAPR